LGVETEDAASARASRELQEPISSKDWKASVEIANEDKKDWVAGNVVKGS
jgi:NOL1/NOP2/fmu family ribosome biogenesis protein